MDLLLWMVLVMPLMAWGCWMVFATPAALAPVPVRRRPPTPLRQRR